MKVLFLVAEGYHGVAGVFEDYAAEVGFFAEEVLPELGSAATRFESDGFDDFALGEIVDTAPAQEGVVGTVFVVGYNEFLIDGAEPAVGREDFFLTVDNVGGAVVEKDASLTTGHGKMRNFLSGEVRTETRVPKSHCQRKELSTARASVRSCSADSLAW